MMNIVERIDLEIENRSLLKHPFYRMWSEGKLTMDHLQGYSKEYFQLVKAVPVMVDFIARSCDPSISSSVSANATEESEHVALWTRFANALGVSEDDLSNYVGTGKTNQSVNSLVNLTGRSVEEAAAAMYAYEAELPKISRSKIDGLKKFYGMSTEDATRYFEVHEEADIRHAAIWRDIISGSPAEKHNAIFQAAIESLEAQNMLLDSVQEKYVSNMRCRH